MTLNKVAKLFLLKEYFIDNNTTKCLLFNGIRSVLLNKFKFIALSIVFIATTQIYNKLTL